jgi:hypothetical protein
MTRLTFSIAATGLIGGALLFGTVPASASTLPGPTIVAPGETTAIEEVRQDGVRQDILRGHPRASAYGPRRHAGSFGHGRHYGPHFGFGITLPGIALGLTAPHAHAGLPTAHVQWCMNRYRTYDPATDTYFPRIGVRARCSSPYVTW